MFSIKQLCESSNISQQTFYRLVRENKAFRDLTEANRQKRGKSFRYDRAVLEWLLDYYGLQAPAPDQQDSPTEPLTASVRAQEPEPTEDHSAQLVALEAELKALNASLAQKEAEIEYFKQQNSQLLLLLQMEKQEKVALLPAPKNSFVERIRTIFTKEKKAPSE